MTAKKTYDAEQFVTLNVQEIHGEELETVVGGFDVRYTTVPPNWFKPQQPAPFKDVFEKARIG